MATTPHTHAHAHDRPAARRPLAARFSLLRASGAQRLTGVLAALAALWAAVFWALR